VPPGTRLYHEGDRPDHAHFVHTGLVKLVKHAENGLESLVELRGPGGLVGGLSAIDGLPRFASAVALTECSMTTVSRDDFIVLVRRDPDLAVAVLSDFSRDLRGMMSRLVERSESDAVALVARRLMELVAHPMFEPFRVVEGRVTIVETPISQNELASWAGVSPRSMTGALHRLRDDGIISTSRLHVEVRDAAALADRCVPAPRAVRRRDTAT
jgi:CRP-like cAMP-binding protein